MTPFALLLAAHITLAVSLLVPSLLLPFAYRPARLRRAGSGDPDRPGRVVRFLLRLQSTGSVVVGLGLAATGLGLVATLGLRIAEQTWLVAGLALYATTMAVAFLVQRPTIRSILRAGPLSDEQRAARARRARYVSYAMGGIIGTIGFLMSSKPALW